MQHERVVSEVRGSMVIVIVALAALGPLTPPTRAASRPRFMTSAQLGELLRRGPVSLVGVEVVDELDLRPLRDVRWPFVCRRCILRRGVNANGVIFERTVDLSGALVRGSASFQEATFRGPLAFGSPPAIPTRFDGRVDFTLARLDELATFEQARFASRAVFTLVRFGGDAMFADSMFDGGASFDRAVFLAPADFRRDRFGLGVRFASARFGERVDFGASKYYGHMSDFSDVRFGGDADFLGAVFFGRPSVDRPYSVTFSGATSAGSLVFASARFRAKSSFTRMTSAEAISFLEAHLPARKVLLMNEMSARNLLVAVPDILRSVKPADQRHVLALLEKTAQSRGDLAVANDALYAKRVLISRTYPLPEHVLDVVFYRGIAGYLVRPFRPLAVLALLAATMTLVRLLPLPSRRRLGLSLHDTGRGAAAYLHGYLDTLALIGRSKNASSDRRLEVAAYRILLVCALIGLANSNPTLRQMIDALH